MSSLEYGHGAFDQSHSDVDVKDKWWKICAKVIPDHGAHPTSFRSSRCSMGSTCVLVTQDGQ